MWLNQIRIEALKLTLGFEFSVHLINNSYFAWQIYRKEDIKSMLLNSII